mgnify:CR=1 FL=1|jgi:CRISPR-associated protein Csx14
MENRQFKGIMIAILGTEPQVVTISFDQLIERRSNIEEVIVVYTHNSKVLKALEIIKDEFIFGKYPRISFRQVDVASEAGPVMGFYTHTTCRA